MFGGLNLAPGWKTGSCNDACQEQVSACLMAFTNGSGLHVPLMMSSTKIPAMGGGHTSTYPWQEGAFYGNLFTSPPNAFFCKGVSQQNIATMWGNYASDIYDARMCTGYQSGQCPYQGAGDCSAVPWADQTCAKASDASPASYTNCTGNSKWLEFSTTNVLSYTYSYSYVTTTTTVTSNSLSTSKSVSSGCAGFCNSTKTTTFTFPLTLTNTATATATTTTTSTSTRTNTTSKSGNRTWQYPITTYLKDSV
jgi:hypothetical protein